MREADQDGNGTIDYNGAIQLHFIMAGSNLSFPIPEFVNVNTFSSTLIWIIILTAILPDHVIKVNRRVRWLRSCKAIICTTVSQSVRII